MPWMSTFSRRWSSSVAESCTWAVVEGIEGINCISGVQSKGGTENRSGSMKSSSMYPTPVNPCEDSRARSPRLTASMTEGTLPTNCKLTAKRA